MMNTKGNKQMTKEGPNIKKKGEDADAKEHPLESTGKKGPKEVDGKKDGKIVEAKKKSPRKDGEQDEHESLEKETPLEQPNEELKEAMEEPAPCHHLCPSCDEVNRRWPPPPYVDPNPRDPTILYPGDEDPEFQPSRGDILIIHPGLHMGLMDLHRQLPKDGFVSSYDGAPSLEFAIGDLVLRMGAYNEKQITPRQTKKRTPKPGKGEKGASEKNEEKNKKGQEKSKRDQEKGKKSEEKKGTSSKKGAGKTSEQDEANKKEMETTDVIYNPYEKLELYTCSGFISGEEQVRLEVERLAMEAEKERLENEAKKKGSKGKKDKKTKENANTDGKKKQELDGKKKGGRGNKDEKVEATGKTGGLKGKDWVEENNTISKLDESPNKDILTQEEIQAMLEVGMPPKPMPKWRYLGSQMALDTKSQILLGKQCPGFTYFYRRYTIGGTRCDLHSLTPLLGDILINIGWLNNWYKNLEKWQKEENNYKSLVQWSTPGLPNRGELIPGMILLRPFTGREHGEWVGWGLDGFKLAPPPISQPLVPKAEGSSLEESNKVGGETIPAPIPPPKCDCHRKSPCPKPPCPCHLYDPCPRLPDCSCIYCNPLPRKPKPPPIEEKPVVEEEKDGKKSDNQKGKNKGKDGKNAKKEKSAKGSEKDAKDGNDAKPKDNKGGSKNAKNTAKILIGKGKDGKDSTAKEDEPQEEIVVPKKHYVWGAVEMYLFHGEDEGWDYWGRSDRICDTPYPLPSESAKPKFLHIGDRLKVEEILEEKIGEENDKLENSGTNKTANKPIDKNAKNVEKML